MKTTFILAAILGLSSAVALAEEREGSPRRGTASEKVFTQDYVEKIEDESAVDQAQNEKDSQDHARYLRHIDRGNRN